MTGMDDATRTTTTPAADAIAVSDGGLTVGEVARRVGVSVRTLHHFDDIGLVVPQARSWAGYRLYSRADIARLQRVLVYRELGFALARIRELIDDPDVDERAHLASQRELLAARIARLQQMVCAVDTMMGAHDMTKSTTPDLTPQEQAEAFGSQWDDRYAAEAEERWGATDEWEQAERVKASMSREDFDRARTEMEGIDARLAQALRDGIAPGSNEAAALVALHREQAIGRWFTMSRAKHVLIARGYTDDPRFRAHYEALEPGLAAWLRAAIEADARTHGIDPEAVSWE